MGKKKYTDFELSVDGSSRATRELVRRQAARDRQPITQLTRFLTVLARVLKGRPRRRRKLLQTARRRKVTQRLSRRDYRHGLQEFIPGTRTKLLSGPARLTEIYCKGRASDTVGDLYLLEHLQDRYGSDPFHRGYLDAGRVSRLLGIELEFADEGNCDPVSQDTMLKLTEIRQ